MSVLPRAPWHSLIVADRSTAVSSTPSTPIKPATTVSLEGLIERYPILRDFEEATKWFESTPNAELVTCVSWREMAREWLSDVNQDIWIVVRLIDDLNSEITTRKNIVDISAEDEYSDPDLILDQNWQRYRKMIKQEELRRIDELTQLATHSQNLLSRFMKCLDRIEPIMVDETLFDGLNETVDDIVYIRSVVKNNK